MLEEKKKKRQTYILCVYIHICIYIYTYKYICIDPVHIYTCMNACIRCIISMNIKNHGYLYLKKLVWKREYIYSQSQNIDYITNDIPKLHVISGFSKMHDLKKKGREIIIANLKKRGISNIKKNMQNWCRPCNTKPKKLVEPNENQKITK